MPHEQRRTTTLQDALQGPAVAKIDGGRQYRHTSDRAGSRLTEPTEEGATTYVHDNANGLTSVDGVTYTWSDNGNLLSDGVSAYSYDHANRLASVVQGPNTYTLDLAAGLTQVLSDGTNAYLYGVARIGEEQPGGWQYHMGDALGSVRQLADAGVETSLARNYEPFGSSLSTAGSASTVFRFTGEQSDGTGLVYLRARYLDPGTGLFIMADPWAGRDVLPLSLNAWVYVLGNPINHTDPSGMVDCSMFLLEDRYFCALAMGWISESFPPAPAGQYWADIGSDWSISGYVYALESEYSGASYETEVGAKIRAKWDFLFGRDGVVMQGTGILRSGQVIHINNPNELYWVGAPGNEHVGNPDQVEFAFGYGGPGYRMLEYYHVAAPRQIPEGTPLFIPALEPYTPYGGVVEVVDRGGQIKGHELDLFVGEGRRPAYDWNVGRQDIRHIVQVYKLTWGYECK